MKKGTKVQFKTAWGEIQTGRIIEVHPDGRTPVKIRVDGGGKTSRAIKSVQEIPDAFK